MPFFPISEQITFLYTADLQRTAQFYENIMGLSLWKDQGTCRIFQVSSDGYLGFCQSDAATSEHPDIILTLVTPDQAGVDAWYDHLKAKGVEIIKEPAINPKYQIYHCFLHDPNGYLIEIQYFL
jgi:catechol 2,3-dioxygenase-like lactoylglutathione lyase family enzyme